MKVLRFLLAAMPLASSFSLGARSVALTARPVIGGKPYQHHLSAPLKAVSSLPIPDPEPVLKFPPPPVRNFKWMPVRWTLKTLLVQVNFYFMFGSMILINGIASFFYRIIKFWMRKVKLFRYGGFMAPYSQTPEIEMKFDFLRTTTYVPWLVQAWDKYFQLKTGMRTIDELEGPFQVPSDEFFISQVVQRTPMAFYTNNNSTHLYVDMTKIDDVDSYPLTYLDINGVEIDKATSEITIFSRTEGRITRKTHSAADFEKAMVYTMNTMSYWIAGIGHSWVHFCFMDATGATVYNDLKRNTLLHKLLHPHFLHTNRINWEALGTRGHVVFGESALIRMASEATQTTQKGVNTDILTKLFTPWTCFPMPKEEFVRNNAKRTTEYYFYSEEFACPPKWLEGENSELPYFQSLKRFYPIVREHVEKVLKEEDPVVVAEFIANVDKNSHVDPEGVDLYLTRFEPLDVITSMIFNAAFVHSTDHYFTHEVFRKARVGIGTLRQPMKRTWYPGKEVPGDLCAPADQLRFNNFADCFVQWNDMSAVPILSNCLKHIKYRFPRRYKSLRNSGPDFAALIYAEMDKMDHDGHVHVPMDKIARSICF
eukprot:CAMPEP_0119009660 /NCGR_PEP_ID=MMETSP1176-20130426/4515_1 /TAXON_ID=265551 /ORGANISM="Synedropsis recta cf, Strain CCMP1620" /LENGTH=594 /DNA_ID=CAMNT_0006962215 /DNA_START=20 /DNA_END=1804 /DNA_ORIENTATION=-